MIFAWPSAQDLGVGGTLALAALYITLRELREFKQKRQDGNGHGKTRKAGDLDPADWEGRIERIVGIVIDEKIENLMIQREGQMREMVEETIRQMFASRTDDLRRLFREELQHFYGLKGGMRR